MKISMVNDKGYNKFVQISSADSTKGHQKKKKKKKRGGGETEVVE